MPHFKQREAALRVSLFHSNSCGSLWITSASRHHLQQQQQLLLPETPERSAMTSHPMVLGLSETSSDNEIRPHQLSITLNGGGEIELKKESWPTSGYKEILFLAAAFYSFIIDVKVIGLQSRTND